MTRLRALAPYAVPALLLALAWPLLSPVPALADHFQFWAAGQLIATGQSPYDRLSWEALAAYGPVPEGVAVNTVIRNLAQTQAVWLYPPQSAFLFWPFGALPLATGVPLFHAFVLVSAAAAVVLGARAVGLTGTRLAFALTLAAVSQPFVIVVRNGQLTGVILCGMLLTFLGIRDRRLWLLGAGVALVSVKPHIALAFGVGVLGYLVLTRAWRAVAVATAVLVAVTVPAHLRTPFPLGALLGSGGERMALDLSTLGALARDLGGGVPLTALLALVTVGAASVAVRWTPAPRRGVAALAAALLLSLALSPYAHDYDALLILPALFAALALTSGSRAEAPVLGLVALGALVLPWLLFSWWPLLGQGDRLFQGGPLGLLPVFASLVLAGAAWWARPAKGPSSAA